MLSLKNTKQSPEGFIECYQYFTHKISELHHLMTLRGNAKTYRVDDLLLIDQNIRDIERQMSELKKFIEKEKQFVHKLKVSCCFQVDH